MIYERHDGAAALEKPVSKIHTRNVRKLVIRNIEQPRQLDSVRARLIEHEQEFAVCQHRSGSMGLQQIVDVLRQPRAAGPVFAHPLPEREQEIGAVLVLKQQVDFVNIYDDLAIRRGLRMVYHHREIDRDLFEKYRRRFCPYCSVASLYLWAVSGGDIPEMKDYKQKNK